MSVPHLKSKVCPGCGIDKPRADYYQTKQGWLVDLCKLCHNARSRLAYQKNRERDIATSRAWVLANKEHASNRQRIWKANNREIVRSNTERRRAMKLGAGVYHIPERYLKRLYSSPCVYCGSRDDITLDHVMPLSRGGTHSVGNIVPACRPCNTTKNARTVMEWRARRSSRR